jgi:hypothetical protein
MSELDGALSAAAFVCHSHQDRILAQKKPPSIVTTGCAAQSGTGVEVTNWYRAGSPSLT